MRSHTRQLVDYLEEKDGVRVQYFDDRPGTRIVVWCETAPGKLLTAINGPNGLFVSNVTLEGGAVKLELSAGEDRD